MSPAVVFFGSYVFAGIAALLLAAAIAVLVAISDFRARGSTSGPVLVVTAAGLIVAAALVVSLGVLDDRGRSRARIVTWVVCGLGIATSAAVFAVSPGESVAWFGQLLQVGAIVTIVISIASAALLALPESNAYFRQSRPKPVPAPPFPQSVAFRPPATRQPPPPAQPPAGSVPPPRPPANDPDYDPFS
jgi:MFS-type transporter involved in bile tolerance (Atg22 family)